jgi:hypothetical protein
MGTRRNVEMKKSILITVTGLMLSASVAMAANCTISLSNTSTFPYTISTANSYVCITNNISKNIAAGKKLITINADNVTLDLQGNELKNATVSAPLNNNSSTNTIGVYASGPRKNITVKNGRINGFNGGLFIEDTGTGFATNSLVESLNVVNYTWDGIRVDGSGSIRNNQITANNTLGSIGILSQSTGMSIINNDIFYPTWVAISVGTPESGTLVNYSVIENNRVYCSSTDVIPFEGSNAMVVNNKFFNCSPMGIDNSSKYVDNLFIP